MRNAALILAPLLLAACCPTTTVTKPVIVEVERLVVDPVPAELLIERPVAFGKVSECPTVAAQRRAELVACNAQLSAIRAMHTESKEATE